MPEHISPNTALKAARGLVATTRSVGSANVTHAQRQLAVPVHLCVLDEAYEAATKVEASILTAAGTRGAMSWLDPVPMGRFSVTAANHTLSKQYFCGLPFVGVGCPEECRYPGCRHSFEHGSRDDVISHLARHTAQFSAHLHTPIVRLVRDMCRSQGFAAKLGGEAPLLQMGAIAHTADVTVANYGGPGSACRVDVKTGSESSATALGRPGLRAYTAERERRCVIEHGGLAVLPFVATIAGQLGKEAHEMIRHVHEASQGVIGAGMKATWAQPNAERFWHAAFRAVLAAGRGAVLRGVLVGGPELPQPLQPAERIPGDCIQRQLAHFEAVDAAADFMAGLVDADAGRRSDATVLVTQEEESNHSLSDGGDGDQVLEVVDARPLPPFLVYSDDGPVYDPAAAAASARVPTEGVTIGFCCPGYPQWVGSQCEGCGAQVPALP